MAVEPPPSPDVRSLVHEFRGLQVMLDSDLAALYGVSTGRLMEQVPRPRRRVGFG
jgi:ORF6N domain